MERDVRPKECLRITVHEFRNEWGLKLDGTFEKLVPDHAWVPRNAIHFSVGRVWHEGNTLHATINIDFSEPFTWVKEVSQKTHDGKTKVIWEVHDGDKGENQGNRGNPE